MTFIFWIRNTKDEGIIKDKFLLCDFFTFRKKILMQHCCINKITMHIFHALDFIFVKIEGS